MALSDYLTGPEWDACFYAMMWEGAAETFGASMRKTIDALIASGYRFSGIDESGYKSRQVGGGANATKLCIFLGNPHNCDILQILTSGRDFLKEHLPAWVDETDEEWAQQMSEASNAKGGAS